MAAPGKTGDYLPVLDGLRAISILLVVVSHCGNGLEKIIPGTLGVTIFFVISGYLITSLLIREIENNKDIKILPFYWRRVLRLFPALLFYLIIFIPVLVHFGASITNSAIMSGVLSYANYYHIFIGYPLYNPMPILWSLSVEWHYYLLFPFLILAFRRNLPDAIPLLTFFIIAVLVWRVTLYSVCSDYNWLVCGLTGKIRTQGTDAIVDCILYGALLALLLRYINTNAFTLAVISLAASLVIRNPEFRATLRYSIQAGSSAIIIANLLYGKAGIIKTLLTQPMMLFIGKLSYSLYLMHFGALIAIEASEGAQQLAGVHDTCLYLFFSFTLASCSYFLVEKPMNRLRHKERVIA